MVRTILHFYTKLSFCYEAIQYSAIQYTATSTLKDDEIESKQKNSTTKILHSLTPGDTSRLLCYWASEIKSVSCSCFGCLQKKKKKKTISKPKLQNFYRQSFSTPKFFLNAPKHYWAKDFFRPKKSFGPKTYFGAEISMDPNFGRT